MMNGFKFLPLILVLVAGSTSFSSAQTRKNGPNPQLRTDGPEMGICSVIYTHGDGHIRKHSPILNRAGCLSMAIESFKDPSFQTKRADIEFMKSGQTVLAARLRIKQESNSNPVCLLQHQLIGGTEGTIAKGESSRNACIEQGLIHFDRQREMLNQLKVVYAEADDTIYLSLFPRNIQASSYEFSDN